MLDMNRILAGIERKQLWGCFHKDWLIPIRQTIREQLPSDYRVFVESETVLVHPGDDPPARVPAPDELDLPRGKGNSFPEAGRSETAPAAIDETEVVEPEVQYRLEIRRAPEEVLVAVLELLSPSNKGIGSARDAERHLSKRDDDLDAGVSVMEIDALERGRRTLPASMADLASYARTVWTCELDGGTRHFRGWGWSDTEWPPKPAWRIDQRHSVAVDLAATARQAFEFNDWESLIDPR